MCTGQVNEEKEEPAGKTEKEGAIEQEENLFIQSVSLANRVLLVNLAGTVLMEWWECQPRKISGLNSKSEMRKGDSDDLLLVK